MSVLAPHMVYEHSTDDLMVVRTSVSEEVQAAVYPPINLGGFAVKDCIRALRRSGAFWDGPFRATLEHDDRLKSDVYAVSTPCPLIPEESW